MLSKYYAYHYPFPYFQLYLKNFGYLEESARAVRDQQVVSTAIKEFQRFSGLSETGNWTVVNIYKFLSEL